MGILKFPQINAAAKHVFSAIIVSVCLTASPSFAQNVEDVGGSQRVDAAGKLRMLSQRIVAAGCNYQAGVVPDTSGAVLNATAAEFQLILDALTNGNADLGIIGAEERPKTLYGLNKLSELWSPANDTAMRIAANDGDATTVAQLAEQSVPLLDMARTMVPVIAGQYANQASLLQSDALAIDIAGRQRMLSQRMSKNVCLVASGQSVDIATAELAATAQVFDSSLYALRDGMAQAGINPPPNATIAEGLDVVVSDWAKLKRIVDTVIAGGAIDAEQREIVFTGANTMTGNMNKVVGLYSEASKLGL